MKTDSRLQQDVIAELKWEPSVHAADIGVSVSDGVVTLGGHVKSFAEKWNAQHAAQRVSGVKAMAIEMDVRLPGLSQRTDADIARSAKNILDWMSQVPTDVVNVLVESGWLTLAGEVDWQYQKQAAADGVRYLIGLRGVSNEITIRPVVPSGTTKADVEAALQRGSKPNHQNISVAVRDAEVTLTGNVHSWQARNLAAHAAWGAAGVRNVVNEIGVAY